jgi:hypothetical protein
VPAVETAISVETAAVKSAAVETPSSTMETTAVKSAAVETPSSAVETPSPAVEASSAAVRCVGEIWLAQNRRAEQCRSNAHKTPPFPRPGFVISYFAHRKLL